MHGDVSVILTEYFHKSNLSLFQYKPYLSQSNLYFNFGKRHGTLLLVLHFLLILKLLYIKKKVNCIGCFYLLTFLYTVERSHYYFYMNH